MNKYIATLEPGMPHSDKARKETPTHSGFRKYFPDAIAEVAKVSFIGGQKHMPGQPLHWQRNLSADQLDSADRHLTEFASGTRRDSTGAHLLAQVAWRVLAELQLDIEREKAELAAKGGEK